MIQTGRRFPESSKREAVDHVLVGTPLRHALPIVPYHLDRQFASDRASRHWVSDMTYVRTAQGWLYLAVVLDLNSRAVVGWAMLHRMQQALVHAALEMTVARRQPKEEVLLHSDRGSQYCAYEYQPLLRRHRMVPSHSRPGTGAPIQRPTGG